MLVRLGFLRGRWDYFVLPVFGPTTGETLGLFADSFITHLLVTIREKELLSVSGNNLDYYTVKGTAAVNFRAKNDRNLESLRKIQ